MNGLWGWLVEPGHWSGPDSVPVRVAEHLGYSFLAVALAAVIAVPLGVWIGHTGRGGSLVSLSGALRALPSLGLLTFLAIVLGLSLTLALVPATIVLVVLAFPSLVAGGYAGVQTVPPDVIDAARATGHSPWQVVRDVELPLAMPLLVGGLRSATLQVVATTTIAAYVGLGGLGRYLFDGLAVRDFPKMLAGSVLVTALALLGDALLAVVQRLITPRGTRAVRGNERKRP